ncbi:MAG: M16 family metallopeptidase, partial [Thermoanaerobaculia bacterium]
MNTAKTILGLAAFAAAAPLLAQKQTPPEPGPAKDFQVPAPRKFSLGNGLGVTFVPYGTVPKVTVRLAVRSGHIDESAQQVWLSDLVGDYLTQGTATKTATQLA